MNPTDSGRIPPLITQLDGVYTLGVPFQRGDSIKSKISVKLAGVAGRLVAPSRLAYRGRLPAPVAGRIVHAGGTDVRLELEPMHLSVWRESDTPQGESRVALY